MRVIIAGSRDFNDYRLLEKRMNYYLQNIKYKEEIIIISGVANGADKLGERYAKEYGYRVIQFPANWDKYGRGAGHIRNEEMAQNANACVVFIKNRSKGSLNMINNAKKYKLNLRVIEV